MIFLDTSAIYALADRDDDQHEAAVASFEAALKSGRSIVTSNYVVVESAALLHRRLGRQVANAFLDQAEQFSIHWVSADIHREAVEYLKACGTSKLSLVDAVSFVVMSNADIKEFLGFDAHFSNAGLQQFVS